MARFVTFATAAAVILVVSAATLFLGGADKTAFLEAFGADVFFDDQRLNCERASGRVATGHVPHRTG